MKTISKIIIGVGIALVLFIIAINIPFEEKSGIKLDSDVLVFYVKSIGQGVISIEILNNGSVGRVKTYINRPWEFEEIDKLNPEELNQLKNAINNNQFTLSKTNLLDRWRINNPGCFDCDFSTNILINKNGETIKIGKSETIWNIVLGIKL